MRNFFLSCGLLFLSISLLGQDSLYTRSVLKDLCSKRCYGRGYVQQGLANAEKIILREIKKNGASPLFSGRYQQAFFHPVNIFNGKTNLKLNGEKLQAGFDYIPDAGAPSLKGRCTLTQKDSVTFTGQIGATPVRVVLKNKLTWTVAKKTASSFVIEVDQKNYKSIPHDIEIDYQTQLLENFESHNLGCQIKGTSQSDSVIVFSAHYDHLGGIGKACYFPGANDNASGVSMVLNLMRYYQAHPPKYTCNFLFFAGEEAGLLGSLFYTESEDAKLQKIKFLINLDLLGTGDDGIMVVNGAIHPTEFNRLVSLNTEHAYLSQIKKRGKAANSDHYWFTEKGVPCFFIYTMGGISAYHDVYDRPGTLPLTKYSSVFKLLISFVDRF